MTINWLYLFHFSFFFVLVFHLPHLFVLASEAVQIIRMDKNVEGQKTTRLRLLQNIHISIKKKYLKAESCTITEQREVRRKPKVSTSRVMGKLRKKKSHFTTNLAFQNKNAIPHFEFRVA